MFKKILGAGISLALLIGSTAFAQTLPSPVRKTPVTTASPQNEQQQASTGPTREKPILVRQRRDGTYEAARAFAKEDDLSVIPSYDRWRALPQNAGRNPEDVLQEYNFLDAQSSDVCLRGETFVARIEGLVVRYSAVSKRYGGSDTKYVDLLKRTQKLEGSRITGTFWRRVGAGTSIAAAFASSGPYGLVVAPSVLGGEANATASDRERDVNRDAALLNIEHSQINIEHSQINIEHSLITAEMDLLWVELTEPLCKKRRAS